METITFKPDHKTNNSLEILNENALIERLQPFTVQSGWLPKFGNDSLRQFFEVILNYEDEQEEFAPSVQAMEKFFKENSVINYLIENACKENENIEAQFKGFSTLNHTPIPRIKDKKELLKAFNRILTLAPQFINNELVGLPFSALVVGIDPTLSGSVLFRLPMFNEKMSAILNEWNLFLATEASNVGFRVDGEQWLSPAAKKQYDFPIWEKDSEILPYWKSWNSFFTRQFKNPSKSRPIADKNSNKTLISPNDGSLFKWSPNVSKKDVFWFKDMKYSLSDILSSPIKEQQDIIEKHKLVELFEGGYIFQTYLNPYNFHRWWVPVNGTVLFDPIVIPGCYFSKLILPDFSGATTESLPYLTEMNARGLVVFKTEDYGHVCCIPLGMSEVSTVAFDASMASGAQVEKGQEMGMFNYGGSSFAVIYEKLPNKAIFFVDENGNQYNQNPPPPSGSAGTGGQPTNIGAQIGIWVDL